MRARARMSVNVYTHTHHIYIYIHIYYVYTFKRMHVPMSCHACRPHTHCSLHLVLSQRWVLVCYRVANSKGIASVDCFLRKSLIVSTGLLSKKDYAEGLSLSLSLSPTHAHTHSTHTHTHTHMHTHTHIHTDCAEGLFLSHTLNTHTHTHTHTQHTNKHTHTFARLEGGIDA